jgi:hypothetical protein
MTRTRLIANLTARPAAAQGPDQRVGVGPEPGADQGQVTGDAQG